MAAAASSATSDDPDGHEPDRWAQALARVALDPGERDRLAAGARLRAGQFSWDATVDGLLAGYRAARGGRLPGQLRLAERIDPDGLPLLPLTGR